MVFGSASASSKVMTDEDDGLAAFVLETVYVELWE
jgi:hypothetical protein